MKGTNNFWFPAKKYGYGWGLPITWQGWAVLLAYLVVVLVTALVFSESKGLFWLVPLHLALTALFVFVVWKKGERTTWRWGDKKEPHNPLQHKEPYDPH